ncbi:ABC transporter ATP-binding protein [Niallia sp. 03133]|uniref:ABC transporter ATP-binding protein n=1 Tax=Niallia sp. 03133 TaxID=3458060 RepID=UPI00404498D5
MIKIKDVSHSFKIGKKNKKTTYSLLKKINLEVERGEIVTIIGRSGSGKSTLLNLISGFMKPNEGEIWIDNQRVNDFNEAAFSDFRLTHIGFVFQSFQLIPSMTAFENVQLPLVLKGVGEKERKERTLEVLKKVGLSDYADHYPSELSGGQQQRISIARALVVNPPLILADEPTGSLDSDTESELLTFIKELNRDLGITFLIITHDENVAKIGDRIVQISDGNIVEEVSAL